MNQRRIHELEMEKDHVHVFIQIKGSNHIPEVVRIFRRDRWAKSKRK